MAFIIGITGGSASGKTTFINALKHSYSQTELTILSQDNYYKALRFQKRNEIGEINFDEPESIDIDKFLYDIEQLELGNEIKIKEYQFNSGLNKTTSISIIPSKIIIVEGLFIFNISQLLAKLNYKIFMEASYVIKKERRLKRDIEERGMSKTEIEHQWKNHVMPSYLKYIKPYKNLADLHIQNDLNFDKGLAIVKEKIDELKLI